MRVSGLVVGALIALSLCAYPLALVDDINPFLLLPAAAAAAFALSLMTREWILVGPGAGVLLLAYVVALRDSGAPLDPLAIVLAVGLLLLLDTLDLIPLLARRPAPGREVIAGHVRHFALALVLAIGVATAAVAAARLLRGGPAVLAAPAALAGLGALVIALAQARRSLSD